MGSCRTPDGRVKALQFLFSWKTRELDPRGNTGKDGSRFHSILLGLLCPMAMGLILSMDAKAYSNSFTCLVYCVLSAISEKHRNFQTFIYETRVQREGNRNSTTVFPMLRNVSLKSTLECQDCLSEQTYANYQGAEGAVLLFLFVSFQEDRFKER